MFKRFSLLFKVIRILWTVLFGRNVPWYSRALGWAGVIYIVWFAEFIPDFIPFFGWFDDLLIAPFLMWLASKTLPKPIWDKINYGVAEAKKVIGRLKENDVIIAKSTSKKI
jgi:uncharacterized membrane protein YkvA (DUF1232 family)